MGAFFPPHNQPLPPAPPPRARDTLNLTTPVRSSGGGPATGPDLLIEPSELGPASRGVSRPSRDPMRESLGDGQRAAALLRGGGEPDPAVARGARPTGDPDGADRQFAAFRGGGGRPRPNKPGEKKAGERKRIPELEPGPGDKVPGARRPPKPKPTQPTTIVQYQDGRLFLPLDAITNKPFPSLDGNDVTIVKEERAGRRTLDFDHARQSMESKLPPGRSEEASAKDAPVSDVVVIVTNEAGKVIDRKKMRDPVTGQFLKVARPKDHELTQAEVDALGLKRFDTSRKPTELELLQINVEREKNRTHRRLGISDE